MSYAGCAPGYFRLVVDGADHGCRVGIAPVPADHSGRRVLRLDTRGLGAAVSSSAAVPQNPGVLRAKSGDWSYQMTPDDLLWLARSVEAEGGSRPDATIWTMAQDLALHHGDSFTSLIRSYSQPVNPIWSSPSTPQCQRNPTVCTPDKIAHRLAVQSKPWSAIAQGVRDKVTAFAQAALPNPVPGAVEFADDSVSHSYLSRNPGARIVLAARGNDYIVTSATAHWAPDQVVVSYQGHTSGSSSSSAGKIALGILLLGAGGGFAYWAYKRRGARR